MILPSKIATFVMLASISLTLTPNSSAAQNQGVMNADDVTDFREDGSGAFRTHCIESHISFDDPLVSPGQPGAAHQHVFFGNSIVDAYTTPQSLFQAEETTCDGGTLNSSAYWVPTLFDTNGERVRFIDPLFYYKTGYHLPAKSIQAPPRGLRMIAGNADAQTVQSARVVKFRCSSWMSDKIWFDPGDPLDHVPYLPDCPADDVLEIRIVFPQCWDGENLSSANFQDHMTYPSAATPPVTGTGSCPASHPVAIPEISYNFTVHVDPDRGPTNTWSLSSDMQKTPKPGASLHADWMNGWDPDIMERIVKNCLNPGRECGVGLLGDGEMLRPVILD